MQVLTTQYLSPSPKNYLQYAMQNIQQFHTNINNKIVMMGNN
jgi:hypothetical protein